ncbi:MAG: YafY family transcriptional regulator [Ignavibacterium sp.]|jgi:predicted DNA-binding transcriptional regulator YafY
MNRTDRLFAILLELQANPHIRAEDLARRFEVNRRTIYRDILALNEAGVPVVATPGKGYSVVEGYFLPPINLTSDEATMLVLGADFVAQNFDKEYRNAAHSAKRKIEAALSRPHREYVRSLTKRMSFDTMSPLNDPGLIETLKKVRRALLEQKTIRFLYFKRFHGDDKPESRTVNPLLLSYLSGNWLVGGWDKRRKALRTFRLSRMEDLEITELSFTPPRRFKPADWAKGQRFDATAEVLFDREVSRWVRETRPWFVGRFRKTSRGLLAFVRTNSLEQIVPWILSWGKSVRVLAPESLRRRIAEETRLAADRNSLPV